jgi:hypothetical protein
MGIEKYIMRSIATTSSPDNFELSVNNEQYISYFSDCMGYLNPAGIRRTIFSFNAAGTVKTGSIVKRKHRANKSAHMVNSANSNFMKGHI